METLKKIRKVTDVILTVAIVIYFLFMFGFTNANVITRYGFNKPIVISNEIARCVTTFGRILTLIFLGIVTVYGTRLAINGMVTPSTAMQIPMTIPYLPLVIGAIGMFIEECILIVVRYRQFKDGTLPTDLEKKEA